MRATSGNKIRPQSGKISVGRVRISYPVAYRHHPGALAVLDLRVLPFRQAGGTSVSKEFPEQFAAYKTEVPAFFARMSNTENMQSL